MLWRSFYMDEIMLKALGGYCLSHQKGKIRKRKAVKMTMRWSVLFFNYLTGLWWAFYP